MIRDHASYDAPVYDESDGLDGARGIVRAITAVVIVALVIWWLLR